MARTGGHALGDLNSTMYLGHDGAPCLLPGRRDVLTVLHTNGFHKINVVFCGCSPDKSALLCRNQLLRSRLFPASPDTPKTVFTFDVLDLFCHLSTQGKLTTYDYYLSLLHLTDNTGVKGWHVSTFFRCGISNSNRRCRSDMMNSVP